MKIYLSGRISGLFPELAAANFERAYKRSKERFPDSEVINPIKVAEKYPKKTNELEISYYRRILTIDMHYLSKCNLLVLLPDNQDSKGSKAEVAFATACDIKILKLKDI